MRKDVLWLSENTFIELDFKQKIHLGKGPRQTSGDFYVEQQRAFIGFGIYHVDLNGSIKCLNMDVVFNHNNNKCCNAIAAFRFIRKQEIFHGKTCKEFKRSTFFNYFILFRKRVTFKKAYELI